MRQVGSVQQQATHARALTRGQVRPGVELELLGPQDLQVRLQLPDAVACLRQLCLDCTFLALRRKTYQAMHLITTLQPITVLATPTSSEEDRMIEIRTSKSRITLFCFK